MRSSSEHQPPNHSTVKYSVFRDSDTEDVVRVLGRTFSRYDPPAVAAGLTSGDFEFFVRLFCPQAAADALSVVARTEATGEVLGALITEDSRASVQPEGMNRLSPKFAPIFDLLSGMDEEYRRGQAPAPGQSLHLFLLGVADFASGRGIGQRLVATCLDLAARKGYRMAVTEATSKASQQVFRKQGFSERVRRSYEDYRHQGRAVFASIAAEGGPILMDRWLDL